MSQQMEEEKSARGTELEAVNSKLKDTETALSYQNRVCAMLEKKVQALGGVVEEMNLNDLVEGRREETQEANR